MIKINGDYNTALCFLDEMTDKNADSIKELCDNKAFKNNKIRIMPDSHPGKGCTIGTTMTLEEDKVVPNYVGVDIGCGVTAFELPKDFNDFARLEKVIRAYVPSGRNIHIKPTETLKKNNSLITSLLDLNFIYELSDEERGTVLDRAFRSLGSLGGGNHFIEVDQSEDGDLLLVVHSGSRSLGNSCCNFYQDKSKSNLQEARRSAIQQLIKDLKAQGREKEIQDQIKNFKQVDPVDYVTGKVFDSYLHDMKIIQNYALANRLAMLKAIFDNLGLDVPEDYVNSTHNYIDFRENYDNIPILRKGAISAEKGEQVIIPLNMRDGLIIAEGLGNPDWNFSAPHGAGRVYSRREAREQISLDEFKESMAGIYTESICEATIDESPMAYKNPESILDQILETTVTKAKFYKPIYNFKAPN